MGLKKKQTKEPTPSSHATSARTSAWLLDQCCSDPLIATMVLLRFSELRDDEVRVPPLAPMVMQLVNIHNATVVRLPSAEDPLDSAMPNWHHEGLWQLVDYDADVLPDLKSYFAGSTALTLDAGWRTKLPHATPAAWRNLVTRVTADGLLADESLLLSLPSVTELHASWGFTSTSTPVDWFSHVQNLHSVTLRNHGRCITDASVQSIALLHQLRVLDLAARHVTDVNCLMQAARLERLSLRCVNLTDAGIADLGRCPVLKDLQLAQCGKLSDLSCLIGAPLDTLTLDSDKLCGHPSLPDFCRRTNSLRLLRLSPLITGDVAQAVASAPALRLDLDARSRQKSDFAADGDAMKSVLTSLVTLHTTLNFASSGMLDLNHCIHLTSLRLRGECDTMLGLDLSALARLPSLTTLQIVHDSSDAAWGSGQVTCGSFATVGSLRESRSLRRFESWTTPNDLMADLCHIPTLTELDIRVERKSTLEYVSRCRKLRALRIVGHQVTEDFLGALQGLMHLETITLSGCRYVRNLDVLLAVTLPSLSRVCLDSTVTLKDVRVMERLPLLLARRRLHTSWFLRGE